MGLFNSGNESAWRRYSGCKLATACAALLLLSTGPAVADHLPPPTSTVTITGDPMGTELGCDGNWDPQCIVGGVPDTSRNGLIRRAKDGYWVNTWNLSAGPYQYKVIVDAVVNANANGNPWTENYGTGGTQDGPNILVDVPANGPVTFYYNEDTHVIIDDINSPIVVLMNQDLQQALGCPLAAADADCFKSLMTGDSSEGIVSMTFALEDVSPGLAPGDILNGIQVAVYSGGGSYSVVTPTPASLEIPDVLVAEIVYDIAANELSIREFQLTDGPSAVHIIGDFQAASEDCAEDWAPCEATSMEFWPQESISSGLWLAAIHLPQGSHRYLVQADEGGTPKFSGTGTVNVNPLDQGGPTSGGTVGNALPLALDIEITNPAGEDVIFVYDHQRFPERRVHDDVNGHFFFLISHKQDDFGCQNEWDRNCLLARLYDDNEDGVYSIVTRDIWPDANDVAAGELAVQQIIAETPPGEEPNLYPAFDQYHIGFNMGTLVINEDGEIEGADFGWWTTFAYWGGSLPILQHPEESERRMMVNYDPDSQQLTTQELFDPRCTDEAILATLESAMQNNPSLQGAMDLTDVKASDLSGLSTLLDTVELVGVSARIEDSGAYCEVTVSYDVVERAASEESPYRSRVFLPIENWNGTFIGIGGSGTNSGLLGQPDPGLSNYAQYSHGVPYRTESVRQVDKVMVWYLANHISANLAQAVLPGFYTEQELEHRIFFGCSRGGSQGLAVLAYHPEDFDGVVAGGFAPLGDKSLIRTADYSTQQFFVDFVNGTATPYISVEEGEAIEDYFMQACDGRDGIVDGIISKPLDCHVPMKKIVRDLGLDSDQENLLRAMLGIERYGKGPAPLFKTQGVTADFPFSQVVTALTTAASADWYGLSFGYEPLFGLVFLSDMDALKAIYQEQVDAGQDLGNFPADLSRIAQTNTKGLYWTGSRDSLWSTKDIFKYFEEALPTAPDHLRAFMAPGYGHCFADRAHVPTVSEAGLLGTMELWLETGEAPELIPAASGDGQIERPWCAFPTEAEQIDPSLPDPNYDNYRCAEGS